MKYKDMFSYEHETGNLIHLTNTTHRKVGEVAGSLDRYGYVIVSVKGRARKAHRVVWEMHHGEIPNKMQIDHINRCKSDNRLVNLRLVSNSNNQRNRSVLLNNSSGRTGVRKVRNSYEARISVDGKYKHLGTFSTFEEACVARETAEKENNFIGGNR